MTSIAALEDAAAAAVYAAVGSGKTRATLAREMGVAESTFYDRCYRWQKRLGLRLPALCPRPSWPLDREAEAIAMALLGKPAAEIAKRFDTTKNAVIGALDRAADAGRWDPPERAERIALIYGPPKTPRSAGQRRRRAEASGKRQSMDERLRYVGVVANGCAYVIGDVRKGRWHFCGAERVRGKSYCAAHHAIMFVKPPAEMRL